MINPIDKMIEAAAPTWAERRAVARYNLKAIKGAMRPGYAGGRGSRRRQGVYGSTAREDVASAGTYDSLIASAMNLYRNDPMTRSIVDVVSTYMGESRPDASTSDTDFNKEATEYFNTVWWGMADARRRPGVDFGTMQDVWAKWSFIGGDMLFVLFDGALYPYEGLQMGTPADLRGDKSVINGVRIQEKAPNRITHYYLRKNGLTGSSLSTTKDFMRIRQNQAIFAPSKYWRSAMLRGVPELHGVVDALQDQDNVNTNVMDMIKLQASIWTVEKKGSVGNFPGSRFIDTNSADGQQVEYTKADYGTRVQTTGSPADDFIMNKLDNPGSMHVPYMEYSARVISAGVGIPMEMVLHLFTSGSYTAHRAARVDFKKYILNKWAWRNKILNQRVYNWVIAKAIKEGRIRPAPISETTGTSEWHKATWSFPYFPQIDEGKEIAADVRQWSAATQSLQDFAQENGRTRVQLLDAHDEDVNEMKARAKKIGVTLNEYSNEYFKRQQTERERTANGT